MEDRKESEDGISASQAVLPLVFSSREGLQVLGLIQRDEEQKSESEVLCEF